MSQNVSRLKELLFDGETRALADLARRIELVATSGDHQRRELAAALGRQLEQHARALADETTSRAAEIQRLEALARSLKLAADQGAEAQRDLVQRLEAVLERAGSDQRLEVAVARVVDNVLRRVDLEKNAVVSEAMAPLITRTIKTEIRNSQDELVEALYPMTGRMVKTYVASAMADLMEQINRKLKTNPLMLRLKSVTTGRPVAELALLETQRLTVEEVYLIRRGTGELLLRWPEASAQGNRDQVMSGVLTAINDFSAEAFKEDGSALRHIDLESSQVYLRASPTYLLAVRCSGKAHAAVERVIDDEFLAAIQRHSDLLAAAAAQPGRSAGSGGGATGSAGAAGGVTGPVTGAVAGSGSLGDLAKSLGQRLDDTVEEMTRPPLGLTPARLAFVFLVLPLAAWLGWTATEAIKTSRVRSVAQRVIDTSSEIKGYPVTVDVAPWGQRLTLSGLTPNTAAREDVVTRVRELLPSTEVDDQLSVVPTGGYDTRPQIAEVRNAMSRLELETERSALARAVDRARLRLEQMRPDLAALANATDGADRKAVIARSVTTVAHLAGSLGAAQKRLADPALRRGDLSAMKSTLEQTSRELAATRAGIMALLGEAAHADQPQAESAGRTAIDAAEEMATQAERLAATAIAVHQASLIARRQPTERVVVQPERVVVQQSPAREPSAAEQLADLLRTNVVWFANQTDLRDEAKAGALLDKVAKLATESGVVLRVVGYTDDQGSPAQNSQLAQARARRVATDLVARGVPRDRLVIIGRTGPASDISPTRGPTSANRRVEIQIGFEGEEGAE